MTHDLNQRIKNNLNYKKLVSTRSKYGWLLTALMMIVYYGFITLIAFNKEFLAKPIGDSVTTWGLPIGLFVILFTIAITGLYVHRANNEFDSLTKKIKEEVM